MSVVHPHGSSAAASHRGRLLGVLVLIVGVLVVEVVGGLVTGSLALLADAGHMATDAAGIGLALLAVTLGARPAPQRRSFGYYRIEILAAVVNAVLLLGVATVVLVEAVSRFDDPPHVGGPLLVTVAALGLVANAVGLALLHSGRTTSLNVRGAYLEVLGDLLGSAAVLVAALVVTTTGWQLADPLVSVLVALLIVPRTWGLLREAVDVLLEATPRHVAVDEVRRHIAEVDGVIGVHDLHVWTITSGMPVLSAHVVVSDDAFADGGGVVLDRLGACLSGHFDVEHCTFQLEPAGHADHEGRRHP